MCISSMCVLLSTAIKRLFHSCLFTAGQAPSLSSTRFCHFSQRTRMVLCLRSYAHPSLAMVSQRPLINKVEYYLNIIHVCLCSRCLPLCFLHFTYLGFDSLAAARIFLTLMERLGFSQFYLQGGDWGSLITTNMAQMKPQ